MSLGDNAATTDYSLRYPQTAARPESDVGVRRDSRQGPTSVEGGKDGIALRVEAADPESSAEQGQEKDSSSNSKNGGPVSLEGHGEGDSSADTYRDAASPNDAKGEHGSEVSLKETPEGAGQGIHQEEEEVEVMMCLWADQAGASVGQDATRESHALAVLQEVVPTVSRLFSIRSGCQQHLTSTG